MQIALIAPPFIAVPPLAYGGTELFVAHLAEELVARGHRVTVFTNGDSTVHCDRRWTFPHSDWPPRAGAAPSLKNLDHSAWALEIAAREPFDVVHVNDALAVPPSRLVRKPAVLTLHHPHVDELTALYLRHDRVHYVAISDAQRRSEHMRRITTIHHGIRLEDYRFEEKKQPYLAFLGRMAPIKGAHLAIDVALAAGLPLKLAGEVQPMFQDYWDTIIKPRVDGRDVEFVGEATLDVKNDLLANATALLFPILWEEPFGLVMIEAMACGTPVLALPGGAVPEVVENGVDGWICRDVDEMVVRARDPKVSPAACRRDAERRFSAARMAADYERLYEAALDDRG